MGKIRAFIKRKVTKMLYGVRSDGASYVAYLRKLGVRIGEGTRIFAPRNVTIDERTPCMIEIGKHVSITSGVTILTHGFDWSVLKGVYGEVLGSRGKVTIGDNVFIGMNSTILKGVTIGNNVIIGANSLVTKDIPDNCVAVGSPAKPVMSLEEYYKKRKAVQYDEAASLVKEYRAVYNKEPGAKELSEFFWLFSKNPQVLDESWKYQIQQAGNFEASCDKLRSNEPMFASLEDFLGSVK